MTDCHDCTHVARKTNRIWTTTCVVLSLLCLGTGVLLGMGLSL